MEALVEKALEATFEKAEVNEKHMGREKLKAKSFVNIVDEESSLSGQLGTTKKLEQPQHRDVKCAVCQEVGHIGRNCEEFARQGVEGRWEIVYRLNLCPCCMYDHGDRPCRIKKRCTVAGCPEYHNPLLHSSLEQENVPLEVLCNNHRQRNSSMLFKIAPVTLHYGNRKVDTLALVDEGSAVTLISKKLADSLGADGPRQSLKMRWTNGIHQSERHSKVLRIQVSAQGSSQRHNLVEARTVQRLQLPLQQVNAEEFADFEHLEDVRVPSYRLAAPQVLIGIDNINLIAPLEARLGSSGEPVAVRSLLDWTVYGPRPKKD